MSPHRSTCDTEEGPALPMENLHSSTSITLCTVAESSDCDSGFDDFSPLDSVRGLCHAKSWPLNSPRHIQQLQSAFGSQCPRKKSTSIRFADSYGLPLVSVLHYRQYESVDEFRDGMLSSKLGGSSSWSGARSAMEDRWSWEDNMEISLNATRSSSGPGARASSWDLPSTIKLRRSTKSSQPMSKLAPCTTSPSRRVSNTSPPAPSSLTSRLRLDGDLPSSSTIRDRVSNNNVCLEYVSLQNLSIFGSVVVKNVSFEKQVVLRYTVDDWATSSDLDASYVTGSTAQDGSTDRFSFTCVVPSPSPCASSSQLSPRLQFAICYRTSVGEFWDSNEGRNYTVVSV